MTVRVGIMGAPVGIPVVFCLGQVMRFIHTRGQITVNNKKQDQDKEDFQPPSVTERLLLRRTSMVAVDLYSGILAYVQSNVTR